MDKDKYNNQEYNPFVYPAVNTLVCGQNGITLFDHYMGERFLGLTTTRSDINIAHMYIGVEKLLDARARMLGVKVEFAKQEELEVKEGEKYCHHHSWKLHPYDPVNGMVRTCELCGIGMKQIHPDADWTYLPTGEPS